MFFCIRYRLMLFYVHRDHKPTVRDGKPRWYGVEHVVYSNVMWNVVQWWRDVEWCGVEWCDVKDGVT